MKTIIMMMMILIIVINDDGVDFSEKEKHSARINRYNTSIMTTTMIVIRINMMMVIVAVSTEAIMTLNIALQ